MIQMLLSIATSIGLALIYVAVVAIFVAIAHFFDESDQPDANYFNIILIQGGIAIFVMIVYCTQHGYIWR